MKKNKKTFTLLEEEQQNLKKEIEDDYNKILCQRQ